MKFKEIHNELSRKQESNKILFKYPNKIPLIVEKHSDCLLNDITNMINLTKHMKIRYH